MSFNHVSLELDLLLMLAGVVTTLPLVLFAASVNRLSLVTMGILHYLAPSITFLLAVLYYGEPFGSNQLFTFVFIWLALALFSWEGWTAQQRRKQAL